MDVASIDWKVNHHLRDHQPETVSTGLKGWLPSLTHRILIAIALAGIGIALTLWVAYMVNQAAQERQLASTERNSVAISASLTANVQSDLEALSLWSKYFQTVVETADIENVQAQFSELATDLFDQHKGFQVLAYAPRITLVERENYIQQFNYFTGLQNQILEYSEDGGFRDALETDQAFPVDQVESFANVELPIGLDLASNPVWLEALFQARDSRLPVAISVELSGVMDYWVIQPLYSGTEIERILSPVGGLSGYVLGILKPQDALNAYLEGHVTDNMQISLRDSAVEEMVVSHRDPAIADAAFPASDMLEIASTPIAFAGRELLLQIKTIPAESMLGSGQNVYINIIGLVLTALLIVLFWLITGRTLQIQDVVNRRTQELSAAYDQLKESQVHLVQSEKMASLGQMVAGFAHEINTPLAYAKGSFEFVLQQLTKLNEQDIRLLEFTEGATNSSDQVNQSGDAHWLTALSERKQENIVGQSLKLLSIGISGLDEIQELVINLKNFSRLDRANIVEYDLVEGLNSTLVILKSQLDSQIIVHRDYGDSAIVHCAPSQINQIFLNVINNAAQAIDGAGNIYLRINSQEDSVSVEIEDDGIGIDEANLAKVMDPFFTTKEIGQGTGLGLSICHKIIQQHGGDINIYSELGAGTVMTITLPRSPISDAA